MSRKITIRQIAEACGVTIATVSRAINRQPGMREGVRKYILDYIESIGWNSHSLGNRFAPAAEGKEVVILAALQTLEGGGPHSLQSALRVTIEKLETVGIIPSVIYGKSLDVLEALEKRPPYGLLLFSPYALMNDSLLRLQAKGVRVAAAYSDGPEGLYPQIRSDVEGAVRQAIQKLRSAGCRKLGIFAGLGLNAHPVSPEAVHRTWLGRLIAEARRSMPDFDPARDVVSDCFGDATELRRMLTEEEARGWFCCERGVTRLFLRVTEELGMRIPEALPTLAFFAEHDEDDPLRRIGHYSADGRMMGEKLVELLLAETPPAPEIHCLPCRFEEGLIPLPKRTRKTTRPQPSPHV